MSVSSHTDSAQAVTSDGPPSNAPAGGETAEIDAVQVPEPVPVPVPASGTSVVPAYRSSGELARSLGSPAAMIPAVQAAAVAAGGFVAGAAVVGLVHRHQRRSTALARGRRAGKSLGRGNRARRAAPSAGELVQIVGSRSLLVDVHLLGGRD